MGRAEREVVIRDLEKFAERDIKRLALNINANLIRDTPRDTGWARSNWVLNIGAPFVGTAGSRAEAEHGRLDRGPQLSGAAALAAGYRLPSVIYETNNVPYIERLNDGSSAQAPAAFVQAAINRAIQQTLQGRK